MKENRIQKATLLGGILTAFMASICCIGPVVFALLGVSGAGVVLRFEKYRPLFIAFAVTCLVTAFFFTYRKKEAAHCEPGTLCANPKSNRVNKIVLWIATILAVGFIFFPTILSKLI